ncbi:MAG: hypothetical protein ACRDN6_10350 [Gaiellaceae bacterium]
MQENLAVGHHQQDTDYYCGGACAQMVLDSIGAGILDQVGLYNDNHSHSTLDSGVNWASGPDGLTWTMNDRRPAGFTNYFVLFALADEDAISRKIIWTIHHYQVAPIALVYGWAHWIVVRGYDASAAPATYSDSSYSINAFDVNNPWPPTPVPAPPPPHTAGDACGGGGDRGIANEHISYAMWQSTYMTGVPGGYWNGKFLAVCDPEPPPDTHGERRRPRERLGGKRLLAPREAIKRAQAGLKEYGLHERDDWRKLLARAQPATPVLVERLDRRDSYYYLVPMAASARRMAAIVSVDARFGDYQQAVAFPEPGPNFLDALDPEAVLKLVLNRAIDLGRDGGQLVLRPDLFCLYPVLVWKPCRESLSPYYPFRMITVGSQRIYIRSDGEIFTELHDDGRGI